MKYLLNLNDFEIKSKKNDRIKKTIIFFDELLQK